ncbi:MAG: Histidine protein kinase DivJ [Firmicutes bacterium ADurb.Bin456]|nr:MAG: Histidine protein kinase DivJ [Firmicutes bacterium ADurb.Bin456]
MYYLAGRFYIVIPGEVYPGVHLAMEFVLIITAVCAALMSWYDHKYKYEFRSIVLCLTFSSVAIIQFAHAVSYSGMPAFLTPNTVNKASTYWIISNLLMGAGLFTAVFLGDRVRKMRLTRVLLFWLPGNLLLVVAVAYFLPYLPPMYDAVAGKQTSLKIALEYLIIALLALSALKLIRISTLGRRDYCFCMALVIGIFSELAFTLYSNAYDTYNLLGHIFKIISYAFIFKVMLDDAVGMLYETNKTLEKQRKMLAETNLQLQEKDRLKDEFLANTNHELRTPLSAVIAFTELLKDESTGKLNDLQRDYLDEINDSGRELLDRINGFLDLSKIAAGKVTLYKELFGAGDLVETVIRRMRPLYEYKGVSLKVAPLASHGLQVLADRSKAGQILTNLLSNALKFTPPDGNVMVDAYPDESGRYVAVSVKDTGIGIAPEDQKKIFEPFQQVDGSAVRRYGGTGIGLTLVKKLVELNGGTIAVSSEFQKGSTFTFTLPVGEKGGGEVV